MRGSMSEHDRIKEDLDMGHLVQYIFLGPSSPHKRGSGHDGNCWEKPVGSDLF